MVGFGIFPSDRGLIPSPRHAQPGFLYRWVVLRYAGTFLDGEARQGPFTAWMTATLAAVLFLVQSGTLLQFVTAGSASTCCCTTAAVLSAAHCSAAGRAQNSSSPALEMSL